MTVGITDRGRVALAPQLGPGVRRITGRLTESSDSALVLSVSSVQYLDAAQSARWSGEAIRVSREYVGELAERRISRTRSWLAAGAVALLAATAATLAITGVIGGGGSDKPGPGDPGDT